MIFFHVRMNRNWQQTSGRLSIILVLKHSHLLAGCRCGSTDTEERRADPTPHALQTLHRPVQAAGDASPPARHSARSCRTVPFCRSARLTKNKTNPAISLIIMLICDYCTVPEHAHTASALQNTALQCISMSSHTQRQHSFRPQLKFAALFNVFFLNLKTTQRS